MVSSGESVDVEDVLLGSSEFSVTVMGLVSFYCTVMLLMQAISDYKF